MQPYSYSYVAGAQSGNPPSSAASRASAPRVPPARGTGDTGHLSMTCRKSRSQGSPPRSHRDVQRSRIGGVRVVVIVMMNGSVIPLRVVVGGVTAGTGIENASGIETAIVTTIAPGIANVTATTVTTTTILAGANAPATRNALVRGPATGIMTGSGTGRVNPTVGRLLEGGTVSGSQASRLDRLLVSGFLEKCVGSAGVLPCAFSDHDFVTLPLSLDSCPSSRSSVWKFNLSLFSDEDFKREMSALIVEHKTA